MIIYLQTNNVSGEKIAVGLLALSEQEIFFEVSEHKLKLAGKLSTADVVKHAEISFALINHKVAETNKENKSHSLLKNDSLFTKEYISYLNKYKDHDPNKGASFPLSTSVLVMFTDQYHLNNFIQKTAMTAAMVIKISDGKKPIKQYLLDILYYTVCFQLGFHLVYQPISARN